MGTGDFSIIILLVLAAGTAGAIVAISAVIGRVSAPEERGLPYECGLDPLSSRHQRFSVKFFLVAVMFLIFDVEVVFLYPWSLVFRELSKTWGGVFVAVGFSVFIGLIVLALVYAWGRGALDWES